MNEIKKPASVARNALLDSARKLMITKGYSATSIDEVCEAAGYTKGTFFHYFQNKAEMGKSLMIRHREFISTLANAPFMQVEDPLERVGRYIDFIVEMYRDPIGDSCLVGMFTEELADSYPDIRALCERTFSDWAQSVKRLLLDVDEVYTSEEAVDLDRLAEHFIAVFEGAVILARAKGSVEPVANSLNIYKNLITNMFGGSGAKN